MRPDQQHDRDSREQFYSYIPHLVQQSIAGRPDRARRAQRELTTGLIADPFYDPVLITFNQIQRLLLQEKSPTRAAAILSFASGLLVDVEKTISDQGGRTLRVSPLIVRTAQEIIENDGVVQQNRYVLTLVQHTMPKNYQSMLDAAQFILKAQQTGESTVAIGYLPPAKSADERAKRKEELALFNAWVHSIRQFRSDAEQVAGTTSRMGGSRRDAFVDLIKAEPETTNIFRERLFIRRIANLSMQDIKATSYPPSIEILEQMTTYFATLLSNLTTNRWADVDRYLATRLFLVPIFFHEPEGAITYRHHNLLANINLWQEYFTFQLMTGQSEMAAKIQTILGSLSQPSRYAVLHNAYQFTAHAVEHDPAYTGDNQLEIIDHHPFLSQAMKEYTEAHPEERFVYSDEIGRNYFQVVVLPHIEESLTALGVGELFREAVATIKAELLKQPFSEYHLNALREVFERRCTPEFLERLNLQTHELGSVTDSVWESTFEDEDGKRIHFLPMEEGLNIVTFSKDSVPSIMGLSSINIVTSGSLQQWQINVSFELQDNLIGINGVLDQAGKLMLKAPLEHEIPGLYRMLNLIAVLVFHDLAVQSRKEQCERNSQGEEERIKADGQKRIEPHRGRKHRSSLPRVQSDERLVHDVYTKTGYTPRRVELHKAMLKYARDYRAAIEQYEETVRRNAPPQELALVRSQLETTRQHAYRISSKKRESMPARFQLETIVDPITKEERYLQTWVIEHTSPKPTRDELQSPVKLYKRYYRRSSALSLLEQLKPWFVSTETL